MKRITFVTTGLELGGAETMLVKLLQRIDSAKFEPTVISLSGLGQLGGGIESQGIPVYDAQVRGARDLLAGAMRLEKCVRAARPDLIQGWMLHGNFAATLCGLITGKPVLWGVRHSAPLNVRVAKRSTVLLERLLAALSRIPKRIVYNSEYGRYQHEVLGYASRRAMVIPNGFDLQKFKPDHLSRAAMRRALQIEDGCFVIGLVARFDPLKDHDTFLEAVRLVRSEPRMLKVILAGDGCGPANSELKSMIAKHSLTNDVLALGPRHDMAQLTGAFDIAANSSIAEGFANALGEAMASGVPCIATRVGDAEMIVGDTGEVVPSGNPEAFGDAIRRMIALGQEGRKELGIRARKRIADNFSIDTVARQYEALYDDPSRATMPDEMS